MFDTFYISVLNHLKPKFGKKSLQYALYYINISEISFYTLLTCFFGAFSSQLNIVKISPEKVTILSILCILFILGKNWLRFNGKRRNVLNAKSKKYKLQLWKLIALPLVCLVLAIIFFQAI